MDVDLARLALIAVSAPVIIVLVSRMFVYAIYMMKDRHYLILVL
jgi:hypothetical protein